MSADSALTSSKKPQAAWTSTIDQFDANPGAADRIENIDCAANRHMEHTQLDKRKSISALSKKLLNMWMMKMEHQTQNWCDLWAVFQNVQRIQKHQHNNCMTWMVPCWVDVNSWNNTASVDEKYKHHHLFWTKLKDITNSFRELANMDVEGLLSTWSRMTFDEPQKVEIEDTPAEEITVTDEEVEASPAKLKKPQPEENMTRTLVRKAEMNDKENTILSSILTATTGIAKTMEGHAWGTKTPVRAYRQHWNHEWVVERYRWIKPRRLISLKEKWPISWRSWQTLHTKVQVGCHNNWVMHLTPSNSQLMKKSAYWFMLLQMKQVSLMT